MPDGERRVQPRHTDIQARRRPRHIRTVCGTDKAHGSLPRQGGQPVAARALRHNEDKHGTPPGTARRRHGERAGKGVHERRGQRLVARHKGRRVHKNIRQQQQAEGLSRCRRARARRQDAVPPPCLHPRAHTLRRHLGGMQARGTDTHAKEERRDIRDKENKEPGTAVRHRLPYCRGRRREAVARHLRRRCGVHPRPARRQSRGGKLHRQGCRRHALQGAPHTGDAQRKHRLRHHRRHNNGQDRPPRRAQERAAPPVARRQTGCEPVQQRHYGRGSGQRGAHIHRHGEQRHRHDDRGRAVPSRISTPPTHSSRPMPVWQWR